MDREAKLHALKKKFATFQNLLIVFFFPSFVIWFDCFVFHSIFIFKYLCEDLYRKTARHIINCLIFRPTVHNHMWQINKFFIKIFFLKMLLSKKFSFLFFFLSYLYIYIYIYIYKRTKRSLLKNKLNFNFLSHILE